MSRLSLLLAKCKAVWPELDVVFGLEPLERRREMVDSPPDWGREEAIISVVQPEPSGVSGSKVGREVRRVISSGWL